MSDTPTPRKTWRQSPSILGFICLAALILISFTSASGALWCGFPLFMAALLLSVVAMFRGEVLGGVLLFLLLFGVGFAACVGGLFVGAAVGA